MTEKPRKGKKKADKKRAPSAAKRSSRTRMLLQIGGFVLVCIWMFVLGILVGRGTAPVRFDIESLQTELADLRAAALERKQRKAEETAQQLNSGVALPVEDLEFYDALKKKGDSLSFKAAAVQKPAPPPQKKVTTPATQKNDQETNRPTKKAAAEKPKEKPQPPKKPPQKTAPAIQKSKPQGRLTIQVTSVTSQTSADQLVAKLKGKGYPAYTSFQRKSGGGLVYRVRIGRYDSREAAGKVLNRIKKDNPGATVVKR